MESSKLELENSYVTGQNQIEAMERIIAEMPRSKLNEKQIDNLLIALDELYQRYCDAESAFVDQVSLIPPNNSSESKSFLTRFDGFHLRALSLKEKLRRMSQLHSTDLKSRFKMQQFYTKQIESYEYEIVDQDVCFVKAEVLYEQIGKLYESFISNQAAIGALVDQDTLAEEQNIISQVQRKVLDIQIQLKKIIKPEGTYLKSLLKKSDFLTRQIKSLEQKGEICAEEAEVTYNHLTSLYNTFVSNQMEIEAQATEYTHEDHQLLSVEVEIQKFVIQLQKKLLKIFKPDSPVRSSHFEAYLAQLRSTSDDLMKGKAGSSSADSSKTTTSSPSFIFKTPLAQNGDGNKVSPAPMTHSNTVTTQQMPSNTGPPVNFSFSCGKTPTPKKPSFTFGTSTNQSSSKDDERPVTLPLGLQIAKECFPVASKVALLMQNAVSAYEKEERSRRKDSST